MVPHMFLGTYSSLCVPPKAKYDHFIYIKKKEKNVEQKALNLIVYYVNVWLNGR